MEIISMIKTPKSRHRLITNRMTIKRVVKWRMLKTATEEDGETTFFPTNSSKEHLNAEKTPQNNF